MRECKASLARASKGKAGLALRVSIQRLPGSSASLLIAPGDFQKGDCIDAVGHKSARVEIFRGIRVLPSLLEKEVLRKARKGAKKSAFLCAFA